MIVVIGAGITGLSAAHFLQKDFIVLEQNERPGGLAGEYDSGDVRFPYGGHYFHFRQDSLLAFLQRFASFRSFFRDSRVFLAGRYIPFPIQYHLACLPLRNRRIVGAQMLEAQGGGEGNLRDFLLGHFGERLCSLFFFPFLRKYWQKPLDSLMAQMDKGSIPVPEKSEVNAGLQGKRFTGVGYNPVFHYPRSLSMQAFIERFAAPLHGRILLGRRVVAVDMEKREVRTETERFPFSAIVNTAPLNRFLEYCGRGQEARSFSHLSTLVVNAVLECRCRRFHWTYLPEPEYPFYRAGFYPSLGRPRVYLERTLSSPRLPPRNRIEGWAEKTLAALGMIRSPKEILHLDPIVIPVSYVLFDRLWPKTVPAILQALRGSNVFSIGRYGSWNYTSMADDMRSGRETAEILNSR